MGVMKSDNAVNPMLLVPLGFMLQRVPHEFSLVWGESLVKHPQTRYP